jgi:hypothetical protein
MNKHPLVKSPRTLAALRASFSAYRASLRVAGSVALSVSAVKTANALDKMDEDRRAASVAPVVPVTEDEANTQGDTISPALAAAMDTDDTDLDSHTLNAAERRQLAREKHGARSVVFRKPATSAPDEPLPEGYTVAPFVPYVSDLIALSPEVEAQARAEGEAEANALIAQIEAEARAEVAKRLAVSFVSDYAAHPVDYDPSGDESKPHPAPVKRAPHLAPRVHNRPRPFATLAASLLAQHANA